MRRWVLAWVLVGAAAMAQPDGLAGQKGEAKARLQNIEQLLEDWDVEGAHAELQQLEKVMPADVEPMLYYRGRIAFEQGRYDDAVDLLSRAGIADKSGSYLHLAKATQKLVGRHRQAESAHFIFYYPEGKDEVLAPYALEALEAMRTALEQDLGYAPPGKVRVEVVNDARELAKVSTLTLEQIRNTGTIAICKFNKLMVTSPKAVVRGYDWLDTLAHEYTHLVVSKKSHNTVPIWLHEGLAKFLESRWRGTAGQAMSPATLALLGDRVRRDKLVPFEKMHPSIALLPTAEDAATAFAEVFFAIDLVHREQGTAGLRVLIDELGRGLDDKKAVEVATQRTFPAFEKAWLSHVKKQPFPKALIPLSVADRKELKEDGSGKVHEKKGKEISFGEFAEITDVEAKRFAHLGELMREKGRAGAAAEELGKAHRRVGATYEMLSNKYALALLETGRLDEAKSVLESSLQMHPGSAASYVKLGRIALRRREFPAAKSAYLSALAADPFDEEIHVALLRAAEGTSDAALAARALKASQRLTGLDEARLREVARVLARDDQSLSNVEIAVAPPPAGKPDASTPGHGNVIQVIRGADGGAQSGAGSAAPPATR